MRTQKDHNSNLVDTGLLLEISGYILWLMFVAPCNTYERISRHPRALHFGCESLFYNNILKYFSATHKNSDILRKLMLKAQLDSFSGLALHLSVFSSTALFSGMLSLLWPFVIYYKSIIMSADQCLPKLLDNNWKRDCQIALYTTTPITYLGWTVVLIFIKQRGWESQILVLYSGKFILSSEIWFRIWVERP